MLNESDLNILVSNIVIGNRFKHCRLCLKVVQENWVKFEDCLVSSEDMMFKTLGETLSSLMGKEICEELPGIDAVCPECIEKILEWINLIERCRKSTNLLCKIFDNLTEALNVDIEFSGKNQRLYVIAGEDQSKIVLLDHVEKKEPPQTVPVKKIHVCNTCDLKFKRRKDLKMHNLTCHDSYVSCDICQERFTDADEFNRHIESNHDHKCSVCNFFATSEKALKNHNVKVHTVYICKECGKECRGLDKLRYHEERHESRSCCPKCNKTYTTKSFYYKHVKLCLADKIEPHPYRAKIKKTHCCEDCGKGYSTPGGLRVHIRFVHGNARPHTCKLCGKKFTAPSYLKTHMIKHTGEKNFNCSLCSKNFVSREALLYHTRRHTGDKPYSCNLCSEKFVNASGRAEHIKYKHTDPKLSCEFCSRKFFTTSFLKQHLNRHQDPSSKLYVGRNMIPPDMPGEQNMRTKVENNIRE